MSKLELLKKSFWDTDDIYNFFDGKYKSKTTCMNIKKRAIKEYGGRVPFGTQYVKADSVLKMFGTNRESEIKLLESINEELR